MPFSICRIKKLKTWGEIDGSESHSIRSRSTPNANPAVKNLRLIDSPKTDLKTSIQTKIGTQKLRKNGVLAVEMLLSASPDYFRPDNPAAAGGQDTKRLNEFARAVAQWLTERYLNLVVRAEMHLDEATPHIHAYIVPLDERGKLNCYSLFGSRYKLAQLQDDFAAAVKHLGIERGIKGSRATHTDIKAYYADVSLDSLNLDLARTLPFPQPQEPPSNYRERVKQTLQPQLEIINHQLTDRQRLRKQKEETQQTAIALEQKQIQQVEYIREVEAELIELKARALDLPLEDVAWELGLNPEERDFHLWKGQGYQINIVGSEFSAANSQLLGSNSIDLVIQIRKCDLKQAVAWLSERFGEQGALSAIAAFSRDKAQEIILTEPAPAFTPPVQDETQWQQVERYLTKKHCLPEDLVKALHQQGVIYADSSQQAVFLMRKLSDNSETVTGAMCCQTAGRNSIVMGYALDTNRSKGCFYIRRGQGTNSDIKSVVLTSTPIDALSYSVLHPAQARTLYLATDSTRSLPIKFLESCPKVIAAYNNDATGPLLTGETQALIRHTSRDSPKLISWNEDLVARYKQQQAETQQLQLSQQQLSQQRQAQQKLDKKELER